MRRTRERGTAVLITMIVVVALLGGGAVLVGLQLTSTRSAELTRNGMTSLYCAEAGLNSAREIVANNYAGWNAAMCVPPCVVGSTASEPGFLSGLNRDLDGGVASPGSPDADFTITLVDNDDELLPLPNDRTKDNDLQVWVISTCIKYPDNPKQVSELIRFNIGGTCYDSQAGGCGGNGNANQ